jgi:hypothetical protein
MHTIILLLHSVIARNNTNTYVLCVPDEATDYHIEFTFDKNVTYEIGIVRYYEQYQC